VDSQDYPIQHLESMTLLASELKNLPAQILQHQYSYESFGSWAIVLRAKGVRLRIAFDGKESAYSIERSHARKPPDSWSEPRWLEVPGGETFPLSALVAAVMEAAA
jgi:hypothetical protein